MRVRCWLFGHDWVRVSDHITQWTNECFRCGESSTVHLYDQRENER